MKEEIEGKRGKKSEFIYIPNFFKFLCSKRPLGLFQKDFSLRSQRGKKGRGKEKRKKEKKVGKKAKKVIKKEIEGEKKKKNWGLIVKCLQIFMLKKAMRSLYKKIPVVWSIVCEKVKKRGKRGKKGGGREEKREKGGNRVIKEKMERAYLYNSSNFCAQKGHEVSFKNFFSSAAKEEKSGGKVKKEVYRSNK